MPATAALLAAIAGLPNGAVVLPGLDQGLDDGILARSRTGEHRARRRRPSAIRPEAAAGDAWRGARACRAARGAERLPASPRTLRLRSDAAGDAPTERWSERPALSAGEKDEALGRLALVEASERAGGGARRRSPPAAARRRHRGQVAALVTPDRGLARRVAVELKRWGIEVDDSAGRPLAPTPAGIVARLVAEAALAARRRNRCLRC